MDSSVHQFSSKFSDFSFLNLNHFFFFLLCDIKLNIFRWGRLRKHVGLYFVSLINIFHHFQKVKVIELNEAAAARVTPVDIFKDTWRYFHLSLLCQWVFLFNPFDYFFWERDPWSWRPILVFLAAPWCSPDSNQMFFVLKANQSISKVLWLERNRKFNLNFWSRWKDLHLHRCQNHRSGENVVVFILLFKAVISSCLDQ